METGPPWKQLKLSFERPYKDDQGNHIPVLLDLTPDGQRIYEPKETSSAKLDSNLRRIFIERGADFFDRKEGLQSRPDTTNAEEPELDTSVVTDNEEPSDPERVSKAMTTEELYSMRMEILPQLFVALGEMSHARDLLTSMLSTPQAGQSLEAPPSLLSATLVTKPPHIISVQAFNSQLTIGSKDEALRKAANLFKSAAESMERGRLRGEKYWVDALRIRRANWGLIPAPLPLGSATGKGADKTSKDFIISYGLEGCGLVLRNISHDLVFPFHQNTRLKVSISTTTGGPTYSFNSPVAIDIGDSDMALKAAQIEVVDQEIFSLLVKEAGNLPTSSARVSERLIVIDASQGVDLTFELVNTLSDVPSKSVVCGDGENLCELIYHVLHVLLLRRRSRLGAEKQDGNSTNELAPLVLQPIIDILQYQVFCERVDMKLREAVAALNAVGIPSALSFNAVGETGHELISLLCESGRNVIGGEAVIRIDNWHTLRFTFSSPSSLIAHLSQATLAISSLPQLSQLLMDEIERCLLQRICGMGRELCSAVGGIWFIDLNRCVARWEGCVL
ncbi:subunit 17 of mediator complex-domain-containing protein [Crassisporium funariophilum]|nr:subunit 17 of mediator complex-domain-containing protein [Crassisporium funariophilum]